MKRLLCIMGGMNVGGAETFMMKIYRSIDRNLYQFDFCVNIPVEQNFYAQEIENLGGRIFVTPPKREGFIKQYLALEKIVKENHYDYVIKVKQHSLACIDLLAAKAGGAKTLALRSSNASTSKKTYELLHRAFFFLPRIVPNVKIAPSIEAAIYTFGKKQVNDGKVNILHNGLNVDRYKFDPAIRSEYRELLGISSQQFVVGHIGRFSKQKNHEFLIEIFYQISKKNKNAVLVLVGCGELEEAIIEKVKKMGLTDKVIFTGIRDDVQNILSALDIIIFPSLYEGMPNTIIEAQANGIPCLVSDTITKQVAITDLVKFQSLDSDSISWANAAEKLFSECLNIDRKQYVMSVRQRGYDISECSKHFVELIFEGKG